MEQVEMLGDYIVECTGHVPIRKEQFHTFHSAYLFAYQYAEGTEREADIIFKDKYIMLLRPGDRTSHVS
jgi:hypothetical protein